VNPIPGTRGSRHAEGPLRCRLPWRAQAKDDAMSDQHQPVPGLA
jgi:hypothetical protein